MSRKTLQRHHVHDRMFDIKFENYDFMPNINYTNNRKIGMSQQIHVVVSFVETLCQILDRNFI